MASIIAFIYLYIIIFFIITAMLTLSGLDFTTSISGAATSISNVGPGLGELIGPNGNFSQLPDFSNNFQQIIDFVPCDEQLKIAARHRYSAYKKLGHTLSTENVESPNSNNQEDK